MLLNGESGKNWQVWRLGVNPKNNQDQITVERMDLGVSAMGTRMAR
jgi:hypothetical protein